MFGASAILVRVRVSAWRARRCERILEDVPRDESEPLKRALDAGELDELPPNIVPGWIGERGPDFRKTDSFDHGINAGVSQENDAPVMFLLLVIAFMVFFPAAYVLLWRSRRFSRRYRIIATVVMGVLVAAVGVGLLLYRG